MSKRRRAGIVAVCLVALAALVWLDRSLSWTSRSSYLPKANQLNNSDLYRYHGKNAHVVRVVDGDTIDIDIPDGKYPHTRIRLWGIDTPETHTADGPMYFGQQATMYTRKLALDKVVRVFLDHDNKTRDRYGRLLAYVQLPDGTYLNEVLLSEGYAYADLRFRHSLYNKYKRLEAAARAQQKGLWATVRRAQLPQWLQRIRPELLADR